MKFFGSLNSLMKKMYMLNLIFTSDIFNGKMFCSKDFLFFKKYFLAIKITDKKKCEIGCSEITWDIGFGRMPFLKDFEGLWFWVSIKNGCLETITFPQYDIENIYNVLSLEKTEITKDSCLSDIVYAVNKTTIGFQIKKLKPSNKDLSYPFWVF